MEVQVPRLPVVPFQLRAGAGAGQHGVDLLGRVVDGARADRLEHAAQFRRHEAELGGFFPGRLAPAAGSQHGSDRGRALVCLGRIITAAAFLAARQQVHQIHRHPDHHICVTVKIHLTSYILPFYVVTTKRSLASNCWR